MELAKTEVDKAQKAVSEDRTVVEAVRESVEQLGNTIPEATQTGVQAANQAKQTAVNEIAQTGNTHKNAVEDAGTKAVENVENVKQTATKAVETAKTEAVKAVQTEGKTQTANITAEGTKKLAAVQKAAQEIIADREQIQVNKADIALLKDIAVVEKASGKTIIIEDASDLPVESLQGTGKIIITGKNILKTEKHNEFVPLEAKAGTVFTLLTNKQPSEGGNIMFVAEDDSITWFAIDKGQTKTTRSIQKKCERFLQSP